MAARTRARNLATSSRLATGSGGLSYLSLRARNGQVIAVGEGKFNDQGNRMKLDVKKGDTVLIGKYSGTEIKIDDVEYTILREDEVLAIVEG